MKRSGCKSVKRFLFFQLLLLFSATVFAADVEKQYTKEYDATGIELLEINNRYGDVEIISTDGNMIKIVVDVQLHHPNESRAERLLEMIEVIFSQDDNTIEARTEIERNFSMDNRGLRKGFSIDYRVEMPEDMNVDIVNRYGDISAGVLSGHVDIGIKYGSLYIKSLERGNKEPLNRITAEYLRVGNISDAGWLELNMRYVSEMNITKAQALLIDSRYSTNNNIGEVSSVVIDSKYDGFDIDRLNNIVAEAGYTGFNIGSVAKKLDIETKYGKIEVDNVEPGFELVRTDVEYVAVRIGFDESASYRLKAETKYAGFSFNERRAEIRQRIEEMSSKYIEAVIGDEAEPSGEVIIDSRYGSVELR